MSIILGSPSQSGDHSFAENYFLRRDLSSIGQRFDAGIDRPAQPATVLGIDLIGGPKVPRSRRLDDENNGGAVASALEAHEFLSMPGAALAHGVRKRGRAVDVERDIFHFDEAWTVGALQTEIESACLGASRLRGEGYHIRPARE